MGERSHPVQLLSPELGVGLGLRDVAHLDLKGGIHHRRKDFLRRNPAARRGGEALTELSDRLVHPNADGLRFLPEVDDRLDAVDDRAEGPDNGQRER